MERDEPLFEISTDKVDTEIPSPAAGTLGEVLVQEGQTVQVNAWWRGSDEGRFRTCGCRSSHLPRLRQRLPPPAAPPAPVAAAPRCTALRRRRLLSLRPLQQ